MNADLAAVGRHRQARRVVLGREPMHDARLAAIASDREDHVTPRPFLAEHRRRVRCPAAIPRGSLPRRGPATANLAVVGRHFSALLIDADHVASPMRCVGSARAVEQQPAAIGRPSRPAGLRAAAEEADAARRRRRRPPAAARCRRTDPCANGTRSTGRSATSTATDLPTPTRARRSTARRRVRGIDGDDARVLRDVRILRIVDDTTPRAVGDADPAPGRIPGRRFALERRQRLAGPPAGRRERHDGSVALDLEQQRAVGGTVGA